MKVSDYIAEFIAGVSPRVYGVCGAGAMHLNDAISNHPRINVISMQHEQAAAMAAEADARVSGKPGVIMVTAGPGGTNAMTGVACAYVDSIPMLIIAGQVTSGTMIGNTGVRQLGMNELDMVAMMRPVTKLAVTVTSPATVRYALERALYKATHGRKGPVFVEIPLDVQSSYIDPQALMKFVVGDEIDNATYLDRAVEAAIKLIGAAERPLVIVGNGVRLAGGCDEFMRVFGALGVPVVSSWGATDIMPTDHEFYLGRCGLFGDRASNYAVQTADLILAIGTRLSAGQIGHAAHLFAPTAKKIIVDVDKHEAQKPTVKADVAVIGDAREFLQRLWPSVPVPNLGGDWLLHCAEMKARYNTPSFGQPAYGINSYFFVDQLTRHLDPSAVVLTDVGFCFIPTMQTMKLKQGQRLIHSAGVSPMGWGLPAAIGACFAGAKQAVCLTGDGGMMMNLQDLQTIARHQLPVAIFVFENQGYATMRIAQNNHFKREVMSGPKSGMSLPDFARVAQAFGIYVTEFTSQSLLAHSLESILDISSQGPVMIVMHMEPNEMIMPRVMARTENGRFVAASIEDLWPHLPRHEHAANINLLTNGGSPDDVDSSHRNGQKVLGTG